MVLALFCLLGVMVAVAYTVSLDWNVKLYAGSGAPVWPSLLHVARTVGVIAVLVGFALAGAGPLLAALVGFGCAHVAIVSAMWRLA